MEATESCGDNVKATESCGGNVEASESCRGNVEATERCGVMCGVVSDEPIVPHRT